MQAESEGSAQSRISASALRPCPSARRIDEQDRAALATIPVRDQERARADVNVARERRDAELVESVDGVEREESGTVRSRADDVVVGKRSAIIGVRPGQNVACEAARVVRGVASGRTGALRPRSARAPNRPVSAPERAASGLDRDAAVDFLVLDVFGARRAHALQHEIEAILLIVADAVVVDRRAQEFARAGRLGLQHERLAAGRQRQRAAARAILDPHDDRDAAAVLEVLLDRIGQRARLPEAAENPLKLREARDTDGAVDGTTQAAADECGDRSRCFRNRM